MKFEKYSKTFLHFHIAEIPCLLKKYLSRGVALADLGAGDGALLVALANEGFLESCKKIVAVDLSDERCARLSDNTNFDVICGDVTNVPQIEDASLDFVICTQVIEHVNEMDLLSEIQRILKKDGTLYIASVIKKKYGWWYYKTRTGDWGLDPTHLREYRSREHFESVIEGAGFEIVESKVDPLKLSVAEFFVRRVLARLSNRSFNGIFIRSNILNMFRQAVTIHPPGYFIIETIAKFR